MKLFRNIKAIFQIFRALTSSDDNHKEIAKAREAGDLELERREISKATYLWATKVTRDFDMRIHVRGEENLPKNGPAVFIANHQSYADIIAFLKVVHEIQIGFIAKDALRKVPYIGRWITRIRGLFIRRNDKRASLQTIKEGVEFLKDGFSIVIFPEGTRSRGSDMKAFKPGSFKLATRAGVPIVPVTIDGSYKVYEENSVVTHGADIDFVIHPPILTENLSRREQAEIPELVEGIIRRSFYEIRGAKGLLAAPPEKTASGESVSGETASGETASDGSLSDGDLPD